MDRRQPLLTLALADPAVDGQIHTRMVTLHLEAKSVPADGTHLTPTGVKDVRLFRNGSLVKIWHGAAPNRMQYDIQVPIIAGANHFVAFAYSDSNVKSRDAQLVLTGASSLSRKGTAYIIAIGINHYSNHEFDLRYATQDAKDFSQELKEKQDQLDAFSQVNVIPLFDKDATKNNILLTLHLLAGGRTGAMTLAPEALRNLKAAEPEDVVFVYFAGHGTSANSHFFLIPHDLGYKGNRDELNEYGLDIILRNSISDDELIASFEGIDASKLVFIIDACNSGQVLEAEEKRAGPMNSKSLAQLAYEKGMYVLTASQSYQAALEAQQLGHGLLTFALVEEGLKTFAAQRLPSTGELTVREWLDYAARRVPELQHTLVDQSRHVEDERDQPPNGLQIPSAQQPRVFYRRERDTRPLIIAKDPVKPW